MCRMVHPGERVEWLQRVQGGHQLGRQLQAHAAPVKLEVGRRARDLHLFLHQGKQMQHGP